MATPQEQQEISKNLEEVSKSVIKDTAELLFQSRSLTEELKDQLGVRTRLNEFDKAQIDISRQITRSVLENNAELRRAGNITSSIVRDRRLQQKVEAEIATLSRDLTYAQRKGAQDILELNKERMLADKEVLDIEKKLTEVTGKAKKELEKNKIVQEGIRESKTEELSRALETADTEMQRLALLVQINELQKSNIKAKEEEAEKQAKVTKALGITGALLDNIQRIGFRVFGGLGINLATFGEELKSAKEEADKLGESLALTEAGDGMSSYEKRWKVLKEAILPGVRKAIGSAVNDPLFVAGLSAKALNAAIRGFKDVDKARVEFERLNGSASSLNIQMMSFNSNLTDTVDLLKQATALTQLTGFNAEAFSKEIITGAAEAVNLLGLTNEQAGKLGIYAQATGRSYENTTNSLVSGVNAFNSMNKTAVSHGLVMRDVSNTSDAIAASLGSSMDRLTGAASAARRLGLELKDLDNIANSLLDFESSIEAELEAQLLTGKNINITKARELALSNDLEGVGKELFNNSASLFEFGRMNRIQQESYAKALGLSREQLAKIAYQRAIENKLTGEALQNATGMTKQQLEAIEITVLMEKAVNKVTQGFTPLIKFAAQYGEILGTAAVTLGVIYSTTKSIQAVQSLITVSKAAYVGWTKGAIVAERLLNAQKTIGLSRTIATAAAYAAANPVKALVGLGVAAAVVAGLYALAKPRTIEDGVIDSKGGLIVSGPKGSIQLDKDDSIIAGTNLAGAGTPTRSNEETNQLLKQLISETRKKQNIYLGHAYRLNEGLEVYS